MGKLMGFGRAAQALGNDVPVAKSRIVRKEKVRRKREKLGSVGVYVRWCGPFPKGMSDQDREYAMRYGRVYVGKRRLEYGPRSGYTVVVNGNRYPCSEPDRWNGVDLLLEDGS